MVAAELLLADDSHVPLIAARMRAADKNEVLASAGFTPEQALRESMAMSVLVRVLVLGGEVAGMFGVVVTPNGPSIPWAMTTDAVDRHPLEFWMASKRILAALLVPFPVLVQRVDARYTAAVRWLSRLGFTVAPAGPWGRYGLPFHAV